VRTRRAWPPRLVRRGQARVPVGAHLEAQVAAVASRGGSDGGGDHTSRPGRRRRTASRHRRQSFPASISVCAVSNRCPSAVASSVLLFYQQYCSIVAINNNNPFRSSVLSPLLRRHFRFCPHVPKVLLHWLCIPCKSGG
jgi:hypothetical protein